MSFFFFRVRRKLLHIWRIFKKPTIYDLPILQKEFQKRHKDLLPFNWKEYYKTSETDISGMDLRSFMRHYTRNGEKNTCFTENLFYGHGYSLSQYAKYPIPKSVMIEHGFYLIDHYVSEDYYNSLNLILTMSPRRTDRILEQANSCLDIGPYIHYAKQFYSPEEMNKKKQEMGKTLLFFYAHSTPALDFKVDTKKLLERLEPYKKDFKTHLACFFHNDIKSHPEIIEEFLENSWQIVSCGEVFDIYFLERLKSLIGLSDLCMGIKIGTHTGYCIYENKPYFHLDTTIVNEIKDIEDKIFQEVVQENERKYEDLEKKGLVTPISKPFSQFSFDITQEQRDIVNQYWGRNIQSPEELKSLFKSFK